MTGASVVPLVVMALAGLCATGLLWWALRGWRQAVPPSCRACGYDVSGRAPDSVRCSECGADLSVDGAIVTAFRRRRRTWAVVAVAVLVTAGTVGAVGGRRLPWRAYYIRGAPAWVIHRQARGDLWPGGDAYRAEWYRREGASAELVDHLLDVQANVTGPFAPSWDGTLFAAFKRPGGMTASQRQRYVWQTFADPVTVSVRQPVRASEVLDVTTTWPRRGCFGGQCFMRYEVAARADGPSKEVGTFAESTFLGGPLVDRIGNRYWTGDRPLTVGPHRVEVMVRRTVLDTDEQQVIPPMVTTAAFTVNVLPDPPAIPVYDAKMGHAVGAATDVHVYFEPSADGRGRLVVAVFPSPVAVHRKWRVCAVVDGREVRIGEQGVLAGRTTRAQWVFGLPWDARWGGVRSLTVALVGDGIVETKGDRPPEYWAGRIVYPGVPVQPWSDLAADERRLAGPTSRPFLAEPATEGEPRRPGDLPGTP